MVNIDCLKSSEKDFQSSLNKLLSSVAEPDEAVIKTVNSILSDMRKRGDTALIEYTNKFDNRNITNGQFEFTPRQIQKAYDNTASHLVDALEKAAKRIRKYHQKQLQSSWTYTDEAGVFLGQQITPMDRIGVYVPGGKAAYPSTVLMNIIPASVAGVGEIIMVTPATDNNINETVLAAGKIAGADRVFSIGGAQAIAALAYGTESVPVVDKIVGPGNKYVAEAKRQVFGNVGIDMIAGPSEILILCDSSVDPDWLAMDLFAQAEHDEDARSILITCDEDVIKKVLLSIEKLLPGMERSEIIKSSLEKNGAMISVSNVDEAVSLINLIAPEHLELAIDDAENLLPGIKHAGAVFIGINTAEVLGDYCAGPNHVLPTGRTARFSSPLGVYDFQKRSSLIKCDNRSASVLADIASPLARAEGLTAHARSAEYRLKK